MGNMERYLTLWLGEFVKLPIITQYAIAVLTVAGIIVHTFAYTRRSAHDAPTLFTTAGIFFTFVGIAEGLYYFDTSNVEGSIPSLLSGLKTAFLASVVGVFFALTLKLRVAIFGLPAFKSKGAASSGATIDVLAEQLVQVRQAIAGQEDGSLLSQLRFQRQDSNDRLDALRRSFDEFATRMSENNSKALIQALQQVLDDFNQKIVDHLGDNFKQLNIAIGKVLEWQERYRAQLSELIEGQSKTAQDMSEATNAFKALVANAGPFHDAAKSMSELIGVLNQQRDQMQTSLVALAEVLNKASDGLPQLESKIVELTTQISAGVDRNAADLNKVLKVAAESLNASLMAAQKQTADATLAHNQSMNDHFKQLGDRTTEQIAKLDLALEKELTRSISTLAAQLTALSKRFVDDYGPLTERLRELVRAPR